MEGLYRLVQMSISASIIIGIILLIRCYGQTFFIAGFIRILWLLVLVRLIVPIDIPIPTLMSRVIQTQQELSDESLEVTQLEAGNVTIMDKVAQPAIAVKDVLILLWFNGMMVVLLYYAIIGIRQHRHLREAIPIEPNDYIDAWLDSHPLRRTIRIFSHDRVSTPLTYGLLKPRIILPKTIAFCKERQLEIILNHEYVHIRNCDYLFKMVMMLATALHWFNPLVWLMQIYFFRDIELYCDQKVTVHMNKEGRIEYAKILIDIAETQNKTAWSSCYFGEKPIKERMRLLMKKTKQTKLGIICSAVIFMFSLSTFAGTGSVVEEKNIISAEELASSHEFKEYETYGINYDPVFGYITYNHQWLGYLEDEYKPGKHHVMNDAAGKLALRAIRDDQGILTGFQELEDVDYINQVSENDRKVAQMRPYLKAYELSGVTCDEGTGDLNYDKYVIKAICDPEGLGTLTIGGASEYAAGLLIFRNVNGDIDEIDVLSMEEISAIIETNIGAYWTGNEWRGSY